MTMPIMVRIERARFAQSVSNAEPKNSQNFTMKAKRWVMVGSSTAAPSLRSLTLVVATTSPALSPSGDDHVSVACQPFADLHFGDVVLLDDEDVMFVAVIHNGGEWHNERVAWQSR